MNKVICIILLFCFGDLNATNLDSTKNESNTNMAAVVVGIGTVAAFAGTQVIQYDDYWKNRTDFYVMKWKTEYDDALFADKMGHAFFTYNFGRIYTATLGFVSKDLELNMWIGTSLAFGYQTYVEIQDGFSKGAPYLGFSRGDIIANSIGAGLNIGQFYYDPLKAFLIKIHFKKSENYNPDFFNNITQDYESTYHWISVDISRLVSYDYPEFLKYFNVALGHSVKGIDRYGKGNHEFFISLDYNFSKVLDSNIVWQNVLLKLLESYRLPAPCVKIHPEVVWYGIKW